MEFHSERDLVERIFGEQAVLIGETVGKNRPKKVCRNSHVIFGIGNRRVIVKTYKLSSSGEREQRAYDYFRRNGLIKVPEMYYGDGRYLITEFVASEGFDLFEAVEDWARVHRTTQGLKEKSIEEHTFCEEAREIEGNEALFGTRAEGLLKRLRDGLSTEVLSITHGDLYGNNVLTRRSINYYIDFENWGIRNPLSDLGLLLFNHPERAENIKRRYKQTAGYPEGEFDRDVNTLWALRLAKVVVGLSRDVHLPLDFRRHFSEKAITQLGKIL